MSAEKKRRKSPQPATKKATRHRKKEKILIIDDEPEFIEACCRTFEASAYNVFSATDATLAREAVKMDPDLIILGTRPPPREC